MGEDKMNLFAYLFSQTVEYKYKVIVKLYYKGKLRNSATKIFDTKEEAISYKGTHKRYTGIRIQIKKERVV
jgi:hypothetical protein